MAHSKENIQKRHNDVRALFKKMSDEKKYKYTFIITTVAEKCRYSEKRVEEIIAMPEEDTNTSQTKLF